MTTRVHLVGSVALDTAEDVLTTAGKLLGPYVKSFGIASERGITRGRDPRTAERFIELYAGAAADGPAAPASV